MTHIDDRNVSPSFMVTSPVSLVEQFGRRYAIALGLATLVVFPLIVTALGEDFLVGIGIRILIYALAAGSLNLILGYGGMVSLGHAAFLGIGAYATAMLSFHFHDGSALFGFVPGTSDALVCALAAMAAAALFALLTGALALRTSGVHFLMITLAFGQMMYFLFVALKSYGGDDGLRIRRFSEPTGLLNLRDDLTLYYICLAVLLGYFVFTARLINSRFGLVVRGSRESERRMAHFGFDTFRYKLACYTIAGAVAGLAGALLAIHERFVSPDLLHWTKSSELLVIVVLGGIATRIGPLFGAIALIGLESLLSSITADWMVILGPILVAIVLFSQRGLVARE
jgi:branched-chain amino acid transport system permease protein